MFRLWLNLGWEAVLFWMRHDKGTSQGENKFTKIPQRISKVLQAKNRTRTELWSHRLLATTVSVTLYWNSWRRKSNRDTADTLGFFLYIRFEKPHRKIKHLKCQVDMLNILYAYGFKMIPLPIHHVSASFSNLVRSFTMGITLEWPTTEAPMTQSLLALGRTPSCYHSQPAPVKSFLLSSREEV